MIQSIKNAIKSNLDALVVDESIGAATITDIRKDPLAADFASYPHAFLMPPAVESEVLDNRTNIRQYTFSIMLVFNAENLSSTTELEETIEVVLNKFDNDPTLGGTALAGVLPVSSSPQPFQHGGKDLIMVEINIVAKEAVSLSFS
ncbi:MAG: hypothetical protein ABJP87_04395 [Bauldia litoralis]|uniref:hypothetical protein n=1 Tax=Bauldia litoralis TaxID=665467 RepID=UPI003297B8C9